MSEEVLTDDQSHYEISLTAGQAFIAFVLLLLSLAASFAFGLMIGKGQADERLVVRKEPAVVNEASALPKKSDSGRIVELGVNNDDFKAKPATDSAAATAPAPTESGSQLQVTEAPSTEMPASQAPAISEAPKPQPAVPAPAVQPASVQSAPKSTAPAAAASTGPAYAQLLVSGDKNTAETLAAKLIDHGFNSAYVERGTNEKGAIYRVRVRFNSEAEARAAEPKLKEFSKDVWVTK